MPDPAVWTAGYEGRALDAFLALLRENSIEQVLDVRENPWSRRPGFTRHALASALAGDGIGYVHLQALGCPRDARHEHWKGGADAEFAARYQEHLRANAAAVENLAALAATKPSVVLCMERRVEDCHRQFLAAELQRRGFSVLHL